jgi:hypothetical protein
VKKLASARLAGTILLAAFGILAIFHLLVLLGLLPSNIVWGGQAADSPARLLTLELVAVLATVLFGVVIAVKAGYIRAGRLQILASTVYGSSLPTFCSILPGTSHLERGSRT